MTQTLGMVTWALVTGSAVRRAMAKTTVIFCVVGVAIIHKREECRIRATVSFIGAVLSSVKVALKPLRFIHASERQALKLSRYTLQVNAMY